MLQYTFQTPEHCVSANPRVSLLTLSADLGEIQLFQLEYDANHRHRDRLAAVLHHDHPLVYRLSCSRGLRRAPMELVVRSVRISHVEGLWRCTKLLEALHSRTFKPRIIQLFSYQQRDLFRNFWLLWSGRDSVHRVLQGAVQVYIYI